MTIPISSDWWLAVDGQPTGPYSEAYLQTAVSGGVIRADQLASPVGGTEWKSLALWPPFAKIAEEIASDTSMPVKGTPSSRLGHLLDLLLAWFLLVWEPLQLFGSFVSLATTPARFLKNSPPQVFEQSLIGLHVVLSLMFVALVWTGGLRLLQRKQDAAYWVTIGLAGEWIVGIGIYLLTGFLQALSDPRHFAPEPISRPENLVWDITVFLVLLTSLILQITSVIWVWVRRNNR